MKTETILKAGFVAFILSMLVISCYSQSIGKIELNDNVIRFNDAETNKPASIELTEKDKAQLKYDLNCLLKNVGKGYDVECNEGIFSVNIYSNMFLNIYLFDSKGKYVSLSKRDAIKLIKQL